MPERSSGRRVIVDRIKAAMVNGNAATGRADDWMQASAELRAEAERERDEFRRLLDAFDRYASVLGDPPYNGSPFEREVQAALKGECSSGYCDYDPKAGAEHSCPPLSRSEAV